MKSKLNPKTERFIEKAAYFFCIFILLLFLGLVSTCLTILFVNLKLMIQGTNWGTQSEVILEYVLSFGIISSLTGILLYEFIFLKITKKLRNLLN